jgi:serine/threonine protein kinase
LQVADHPNIVKLKEVVTSRASEATRNKGSVFMVFEYCECDLVGLMKASKLSEPHIMCLLKQLMEAVHFTHLNRVLHRDIKPSNILVNSQGILKLADWGLCRRYAESGKFTNRVVTRWYRAPELLLGEQQYSTAIDMWAVGCVMAELLLGRALFPGVDDLNQLKIIFDLCGRPAKEQMPTGWEHLPHAKEVLNGESTPSQLNMRFAALRPSARDLIVRLLELDPAKRMSAKDALNHDYFWGNPGPCHPELIPVPRGDGLHELQVREEYQKKHAEASSAAHSHDKGGKAASRN